MKDSILKGTGNSRFLKSAVPAGTSWADALAMLRAGTFPIDFNGINTEGFQQVGTPLNKANLLKDATALTLGLTGDVVPNDMFNALAHAGDLHVWRKTITSGTGTYSLGAVQKGLHYIKWANNSATSDSSGTFEYGSEIAVNKDGTITGIKNPSTITIKPWDDEASKANVFKGKFIKMISQVETGMSHFKIGEIWWIPADAAMTKGLLNGESNRWYIAASKRQQVIGVPAGTTVTYPVSTNRNAYQEGSDAKEAGYTLGDVKTGSFAITSKSSPGGVGTYWNDSAALSVSDDGTCTLATTGGTYIDGTTTNAATTAKNELQGKFAYCNNTDTDFASSVIVFFPSNTIFTRVGNIVYADRYQPVTGYAAIPANTTIEYLGCLGDKARVQVVSYVGTGTYGEDNPCSITADFKIKIAIMMYHYLPSAGSLFMISDELSTNYTSDIGFSEVNANYSWGKKSADGKTLFWYGTRSASGQFNESGRTYYAIAIG